MVDFISFLQSFLYFARDSLSVALWGSGVLIFLVLILLVFKPQRVYAKIFFFIVLSLVAVSVTFYIVGATITLVNTSPTKGPVHWHADFRIFNCGEEIDLLDPEGFANRVGTSVIHEHGDKRIHIEGVPETYADASIGNFISLVGGHIGSDTLHVPTNNGVVEMKNGTECPDGEGVLQAFLWETDEMIATQRPLPEFIDYVIAPETLVPPGDCVIFEFNTEREKTEYICQQYLVAEERGDLIIVR